MNLPTENYIWIANSFALKDLKLSDFIQYIIYYLDMSNSSFIFLILYSFYLLSTNDKIFH